MLLFLLTLHNQSESSDVSVFRSYSILDPGTCHHLHQVNYLSLFQSSSLLKWITNHHSYYFTSNSPHGAQRDFLKNILRKCHFRLQYLSVVFHHTQKKKKNLASQHFYFYIQIFPPVSLLKSTDLCWFGNRLNTLKFSSPNSQETWLSSLRSLLKSHLARGWFSNHLFTILCYLVLVLKQMGDYILSVQLTMFDHQIC